MGDQDRRSNYNYKKKRSRSRSRDKDKDRNKSDKKDKKDKRKRDYSPHKESKFKKRKDSSDSYDNKEKEKEKIRQKQIRLAKIRAMRLEEEFQENRTNQKNTDQNIELEQNFIKQVEVKQKQEEQLNKQRQQQRQQEEQQKQQQIDKENQQKLVEKQNQEEKKLKEKQNQNESEKSEELENILLKMNEKMTENQKDDSNIFEIMRQQQLDQQKQFQKQQQKSFQNYQSLQYIIEEDDPLEQYMKELEKTAVKQEQFKIYTQDNKTFIKSEEDNKQEELMLMQAQMIDEQYNNEIDQGMVISQEQIENQFKQSVQQQQQEEQQKLQEEQRYHDEFIKAIKNKQIEQKAEEERKKEEKKEEEKKEKLKCEDLISDDEDGYYMEEVVQLEEEMMGKEGKKQEKKEMKVLDHSMINYKPFKKNFYIECEELKKMNEEEVEVLRAQLGGLKVRGKDCPKPLVNWHQCGLSNKILLKLKKKEFTSPFPIQAQCIPAMMSGRDVIGIAETGSGKTLAYILPMLRHILDQRRLEEDEGMIGLIMAPTRELCNQIYSECRWLCSSVGLEVACVYGGAGVAGQLSQLKKGAEIVVCTPGRMIDILSLSNGKITNLKRVTFVVLDEADRMFDLGFEPQISKILNNIRPDRQTVMLSATFPRNVENLARKILNRPVEVVVGQRGSVCINVEQQVEVREESTKLLRLLELLGEYNEKGKVLVFVDKQSEADLLFRELLKHGYLSLVLHGGQDQMDREFTIQDFKKGLRTLMIATSVCARGLDIKELVLVVNFKCPNHIEDYIHRIGRTGRAGHKGVAITFITPQEDQYAYEIIKALQANQQPVSDQLQALAVAFRAKVAAGQAKVFVNRNLNGTGFKFDIQEKKKLRQFKLAMKKQFGYEYQLSDDDDENVDHLIKSKADKDLEDQIAKEKKIMENQMNKDPQLKTIAMDNAKKVANSCIQQGYSSEQVLKEAHEAIKKTILDYRPNAQTVEKGLAEAVKVRDELLNNAPSMIKGEKMTAELEINDFPATVRGKMINKDYLGSLYDLNGCQVTVRGIYIDPTRKTIQGAKKLYLLIEGEDKYSVQTTYKELKSTLAHANMLASQNHYTK